ncbi:MAG: lipid-A-disaccharide synthase [Cyanobacteria bacterium J06598_3]
MATSPVDIVILSNGPGEVATWVKPVVQALHQKTDQKTGLTPSIRISVLLSPCPHASGQEHTTLAAYPEIDRVQSAPHFFNFLLTGKTADSWDWHPQGVVVFLGGDQLYTVLVAKRLGYRTVTYAEWDARWPRLIDRFGVMQADLTDKAPAQHQPKFTVVGDLMADVQTTANRAEITTALGCAENAQLIGLLPGSKPTKLSVGVPMFLSIAQMLHQQYGQFAQCVIGVAPNVTLPELIRYTDPAINNSISTFPCPPVTLIEPDSGLPYLQIEDGPKIFLWQRFPALDLFSQCELCFTTVGANTAQLGALATPMIVILPTQRLGDFQLADGVPGLISRLPGVGAISRKLINPLIIAALQKSGKRFAWPNIWAKREVVPELFGPVTAQAATNVALDHLNNPEKLEAMRQTLRTLRGPAGAADKMANLILETVYYPE